MNNSKLGIGDWGLGIGDWGLDFNIHDWIYWPDTLVD